MAHSVMVGDIKTSLSVPPRCSENHMHIAISTYSLDPRGLVWPLVGDVGLDSGVRGNKKGKSKGEAHTLDVAPVVKEPQCRSAQVWHALSTDFTVLLTRPRAYPRME